MSARRIGGAGLVYGAGAGVVLLVALGLIGLGLARMTAASTEAVPFRSACQGDDACRQALVERLPTLQSVPGGAPAWLHEALARSAPGLVPDSTLAACQATGTPDSCALDPAKLKPGEAGALIAILDAHSLAATRQGRACRYLEGCATRALAALGEYGFDPIRIQGALQRTSYPLPPALQACADAGPDTARGACGAESLLKAAPEPLTIALEQDWRSGGAQARLPRPVDPQAELTENALWAGLGAALGMLVVGLAWAGAVLAGRSGGGARLSPGPQGRATVQSPALFEPAPHPAPEPAAAPARPTPSARAAGLAMAPSPDPFVRDAGMAEGAPARTTPVQPRPPPVAPASRPAIRRAAATSGETRAPSASPPPELVAFRAALSIPVPVEDFTRLAAEEGARLSPRFDQGERLAAGVILAAHSLRGDRPAEAHAGAYDDLVSGLAGADHRLVWPRPGAPITAEMETCDEGDLYSHTVEAVVRPGLIDGSGALVLRARVRAR